MLQCVSCYNIFILSHVVSLPIQAKQDTEVYICLHLDTTVVSCSAYGKCEMAVSASMAKVLIQFLRLYCRLYLRPLLRSASSSLENVISVLLPTRG
jgi:hypothetical protein